MLTAAFLNDEGQAYVRSRAPANYWNAEAIMDAVETANSFMAMTPDGDDYIVEVSGLVLTITPAMVSFIEMDT